MLGLSVSNLRVNGFKKLFTLVSSFIWGTSTVKNWGESTTETWG